MPHVCLNCPLPALECDTTLMSSLTFRGSRRTGRDAHCSPRSARVTLGSCSRRSRGKPFPAVGRCRHRPLCWGKATRQLRDVFSISPLETQLFFLRNLTLVPQSCASSAHKAGVCPAGAASWMYGYIPAPQAMLASLSSVCKTHVCAW